MTTTGANQPSDDNVSSDEASERQRRRRIRIAAIGVPSAAALAAIGFVVASGGGASSATSKPPPAASSILAGTVVHTAHSSTLGTVLGDGRGMTLYTLTNNGVAVSGTGPFATIGPPLAAAPGMTPSAPGLASIGTAASATFGAEWHAVKVGAAATVAPGAARADNATTTPKPAAGGYGY